MKLIKKNNWAKDEYVCLITQTIDLESNKYINQSVNYVHYLLDYGIEHGTPHIYAIRIPGRTIGELIIDENNKITSICIYEDCIGPDNHIDRFKTNINDVLKVYIGGGYRK